MFCVYRARVSISYQDKEGKEGERTRTFDVGGTAGGWKGLHGGIMERHSDRMRLLLLLLLLLLAVDVFVRVVGAYVVCRSFCRSNKCLIQGQKTRDQS